MKTKKNPIHTRKSGFCFSLIKAIYTTFAHLFFESVLYCCKRVLAMALDEGEGAMLLLTYFMIFVAMAPGLGIGHLLWIF
jgi:hypothetical protein